MLLIEKIRVDQVQARKNKDTRRASLLTTLLSEATMVGKNQNRVTTNDEVVAVVKKFLKNNDEFKTKVTCGEQLGVLMQEENILTEYLPKQLTHEEIEQIIEAKIAEGVKDMGSLMRHMKENYLGQYDAKTAQRVIQIRI